MKRSLSRPPLCFSLSALVVLAWLSGCASAPPTAVPVTAAPAPSAPKDDLPRIALEPDVMYDVLVGEMAVQRGQIGIAAQVLGRAAQKTRDPRLAERATLAAFHARQMEEALTSGQLWTELRPNDVEAREALAMVLLESGRPAEARIQLEKILALDMARNQLDQGYLRVATVLGRHSNRTAATELMQALVKLHPELGAAHLYAAHIAVRAGDLDGAARSADAALKLQPGSEEAAIFRVRIHVSQKDISGALGFYETFLRKYPKSANVRTNYARFLIDQKQWGKALVHFKRVLSEMPDDADAVYAAGLLALQTNRPAEADQYLRRTLELRPDNDQARLYLGQVAEQEKRYDDAVRWYKEINDGEGYFEAQIRLAAVVAKKGDVDGARVFLAAIQLENDQQRVQRALAEDQILRDAKRHNDALEMLNQTLVVVPGDKDLLYARALVAEKLDKLDLAESDLRAILKKDPKNANALNALGYTLADRTARFDEALALLQEAVTLKPDDPYVLDSFGWVNYRLGNHAEALKYLKRALELRNDAEIAAHLGEVLWVTGQRNEAESVWKRALHETPDSEVLHGVMRKFQQ